MSRRCEKLILLDCVIAASGKLSRMSANLLRVVSRIKVPQRAINSTAARSTNIVLDQKLKDEIYPKIGNREVVGFGINGQATYVDKGSFPCPAIRFKEDTPEILKLREKEKGDWKSLTLDEKKELYRASFCQTYSEMSAPTGEWKAFVAAVLFAFVGAGWLMAFVKKVVYPPPPSTITRDWQEASLQRMLDQEQGIIAGVSSKWDYEKLEWKK
ncbi:cytochrome c oxidase subunit 4 isoform 2, mitochondrial [Elysia marginata]|uniref:Cytochrome c oxidase subunit 4 n=1 Tax=Elysia marginata TaxID=1093978 RepID=A0AAV4I3C0_9GAST|nr:cytochrome c oxidase subunit 4 isoform 2, mitochondrial [Elysia marginata]